MVEPVRQRASENSELFGLVARFDSAAALKRAARGVRSAGFRCFDVHSPFPVHGIEKAMGLSDTHLPWLVLGAGLCGTALALGMQWWMNAVDYPFRISAKPLFGLPAAIPITFELTVLLAAFGAFLGMLALNRLPEHHHPLFELKDFRRATDDAFFLSLEARDPCFERGRAEALLATFGPQSIEACPVPVSPSRAPRWLRLGLAALALFGALPFACIAAARAAVGPEVPFHLVSDMDFQPRYRAQAENSFFADGRAMRPNPQGSVPVEALPPDEAFATGKRGADFVPLPQLPMTVELLERGRERFAIHCAPCHGLAGYGDGPVARRAAELQEPAWVTPASLHDALVRARPAGQVFDVIQNGARSMPAYRSQISREDCWAIVAYVQALQRSQHASFDDLPPTERQRLGAH